MSDDETGFDEQTHPTQITQFDFDAIDGAPTESTQEQAIALASYQIRRICAWQWSGESGGHLKDLDGLVCRSTVVAWIFVPQLRSYTLTQIAGRVGKRKQSIGRAVRDFKDTFPELAKHLQHIRE